MTKKHTLVPTLAATRGAPYKRCFVILQTKNTFNAVF